ncbi:hypothetical protein SAMN04487769_0467 [Burkholderia sp. b14]|nr:hypothetical protein SAMN04487769_0467 [Burkholderia sp. b14]
MDNIYISSALWGGIGKIGTTSTQPGQEPTPASIDARQAPVQGQLSVLREHSRALKAARFARTSSGVIANQPDSAVHVAKRNAQAYGSMPPVPKRLLLTAPFTPSESVLESVPSSTERPQLSKTDAQGLHKGQPALIANHPNSAVHVAKRKAQAYGSTPPAPKRLLLTAPFSPCQSVLESVSNSTECLQLSKTDAQGSHNGQPALTLEQLNSLLASSPLPSVEAWHGGYEEQPALTLEQFNPLFASSPLWSGKPLP